MFEQIDTLPRAERKLAIEHWNRNLRLGQSRPDVRSHVIEPFRRVAIEASVLGYETSEKVRQVRDNIRVGVLLDHKRRRSMLAEHRQQTSLCALPRKPRLHLAGEFVQPIPVRRNVKLVRGLRHSTVTLFARFRG